MSAERPILIVDDDQMLRQTLVDQLAVDGEFFAVEAETIEEAENHLLTKAARFDAIILDVGLPDGDGRDLCAKLRKRGHRLPIIMLTGLASEVDVIRGLNCGANDYIAKPFKLSVLLARLRAQLRIYENSEDAVFVIGPYTFRPSAKLLQDLKRGRRIRLTEKEAAILKFLYRAGTRSVTRQVLLNEVWGYNAAVTTHTLETHIYRLRQKIESDPANARLLVTEGGGIGWIPRVSKMIWEKALTCPCGEGDCNLWADLPVRLMISHDHPVPWGRAAPNHRGCAVVRGKQHDER